MTGQYTYQALGLVPFPVPLALEHLTLDCCLEISLALHYDVLFICFCRVLQSNVTMLLM